MIDLLYFSEREMDYMPLFAESDVDEESEVVAMEQDPFLSERVPLASTFIPPYALTVDPCLAVDPWQFSGGAAVGATPPPPQAPQQPPAVAAPPPGRTGSRSGSQSGATPDRDIANPEVLRVLYPNNGLVAHSMDPILAR